MISRLRKRKPDFKSRGSFNYDEWFYDQEFDKDLIEASFASQYGIRLRQEIDTITYAEYARLLSGLLPETPFGRVVQLRMEKDPKIVSKMTRHEKKLRNDWAVFKSRNMPKSEQKASIAHLQNLLKGLAKKGKSTQGR